MLGFRDPRGVSSVLEVVEKAGESTGLAKSGAIFIVDNVEMLEFLDELEKTGVMGPACCIRG